MTNRERDHLSAVSMQLNHALAEADRLGKQRDAVIALLRKLEWSSWDATADWAGHVIKSDSSCPCCGANEKDGEHRGNCELKRLIDGE